MGGSPDGRIPATEVYAVHTDSCTRVTTDFRQALAQPSLGPLGADLAFPDPFRSGATRWSPPTLPQASPIPNLASSQPAVCGINPGTCFFWHWALSPLQTKTLGCQNYCFNHEFWNYIWKVKIWLLIFYLLHIPVIRILVFPEAVNISGWDGEEIHQTR